MHSLKKGNPTIQFVSMPSGPKWEGWGGGGWTLKGQYHAIFSNALKIENMLFG